MNQQELQATLKVIERIEEKVDDRYEIEIVKRMTLSLLKALKAQDELSESGKEALADMLYAYQDITEFFKGLNTHGRKAIVIDLYVMLIEEERKRLAEEQIQRTKNVI